MAVSMYVPMVLSMVKSYGELTATTTSDFFWPVAQHGAHHGDVFGEAELVEVSVGICCYDNNA